MRLRDALHPSGYSRAASRSSTPRALTNSLLGNNVSVIGDVYHLHQCSRRKLRKVHRVEGSKVSVSTRMNTPPTAGLFDTLPAVATGEYRNLRLLSCVLVVWCCVFCVWMWAGFHPYAD